MFRCLGPSTRRTPGPCDATFTAEDGDYDTLTPDKLASRLQFHAEVSDTNAYLDQIEAATTPDVVVKLLREHHRYERWLTGWVVSTDVAAWAWPVLASHAALVPNAEVFRVVETGEPVLALAADPEPAYGWRTPEMPWADVLCRDGTKLRANTTLDYPLARPLPPWIASQLFLAKRGSGVKPAERVRKRPVRRFHLTMVTPEGLHLSDLADLVVHGGYPHLDPELFGP